MNDWRHLSICIDQFRFEFWRILLDLLLVV